MTAARKPEDAQPLSAGAYAIIALVGFVVGIGLLLFYVNEVPRLVETSSQNQVYYLLLIPWALACAAFLFGAMRSYGRFTHRHLGNALELGGPVVLFCLVLAGGFKLVPGAPQIFDLTVRAHSEDDKEAKVTEGSVTIDFDTDRRTETFNSIGEANFKGIPQKFQGATLRILAEVPGYEEKWQRHKLHGYVLELPLVRATRPISQLAGSIVPPPADWKVLRVIVDGQPTEGKVDELGRFNLEVNGKDGDRIRLRVYAGTKLIFDREETLPGPLTLTLH